MHTLMCILDTTVKIGAIKPANFVSKWILNWLKTEPDLSIDLQRYNKYEWLEHMKFVRKLFWKCNWIKM